MTQTPAEERERAYRYDLFIAPEWDARFDVLIAEHVEIPDKGMVLEINCGTGARAIQMSESLKEGEVIGVDSDAGRVAIARAKAQAVDAERCSFSEADPAQLAFDARIFDLVLADATREAPERLRSITSEAARVASGGAPVAVMATLRGSFDEFSSVYWEALYELGMVEEVWPRLEGLITARPTLEEAVDAVRAAGVVEVTPHQSKEEFRFDSGAEFLASPLVADLFLDEWLSIVPRERVEDVRRSIERIIDRERGEYYFDFSVKAVLVAGQMPE